MPMARISMADILELGVDERVKLAQDIWDSVAEHPESIPVTPAQRAELDRRLEEFERDPDSGSDWTQTRRRIEKGP